MRPTLEEQLRWNKKVQAMTDKEVIKFFTIPLLDRFLFKYFGSFLWRVVRWNWFCIYCGKTHFRWSDAKCEKKYHNDL